MIQVRSSGESPESVREINSNVFCRSKSERGLMEDDPPIAGIPHGIMLSERIGELMLRYEIPSEYLCKILGNDKYISSPSPLKVAMCEETF